MSSLITMSRLGTSGQWGNQLIQYAFIRTYANRYGLGYQVPPWAGQHFFGLDDPPVTETLPPWEERYRPAKVARFGVPIPPIGNEVAGHDFIGWAQYHANYYRQNKKFIKGLANFTPTGPVASKYRPILRRLQGRGKTIIGLHIRRGENGRLIYLLTPMAWYLKWLHENWGRFDDPVLFLAVEEPEFIKPFREYNPVTIDDLGYAYKDTPPPKYKYPHGVKPQYLRQMNFFGDWYLLQSSDVVLASESTYSFTAAWLSELNKEFWWPRLSAGGFEKVDPWYSHMSPREFVDDYPDIPGISLDENPAWDGPENKHPAVSENPEDWRQWATPP